ncbi:aminomethyl-transferring glycine dehydrogenase subunit GcvPA [Natronoarchaeum sp. GCM10025321]|uniref:aminomethyl-transferring glycine dehydrogenase subunit GcvPA n=1 Tax=Natronoarchaeum sp. GCM10025321 TaxID=3252684 RepID=UPI003614FDCB
MTRSGGSPYAPHTPSETDAMLAAIGVDEEADLFDIPEGVGFDGEFGIDARSEREVREDVERMLGRNDTMVELLGRGHYDGYIPSLVDHLSQRSEFLTSYTQYQPEVSQGFLQALFEYQSIFAELTGLGIVNCSMYDAATALGETATLADRVRSTAGDRVLVPEHIRDEKRAVLANYVAGTDLSVETYEMDDGCVDVDALADRADDDAVLVYAETPTVRGVIEEHLNAVADIADDHGALFALGSDPIALSVLEEPETVGADVVIGDASVLGLPASHGMGLGMFATREEYVRQVPGRLVGASKDAADRRAYTLTLQTREQHIRQERATSNICTNQAWVALRAAIHATWLGPSGLVEAAKDSISRADRLADAVDQLSGVDAPVHDRHHFREFVASTERPAEEIAAQLADLGYAVHALDDHEIQLCVNDLGEDDLDGFVAALTEVVEG